MINYQIMNDSQKQNEKYYPDYDKLLANANEAEMEYIKTVQSRNISFVYNMVYITKLTCGHYEIFQTPCNQFYSLKSNLKIAKEYAESNKCTHCICDCHPRAFI